MQTDSDYLLFQEVVNELRLPLLQISRLSEVGGENALTIINEISEHSLRLVQAYAFVTDKGQPVLEPVNLRASLEEAAHAAYGFARANSCELAVDAHISSMLVLANRDRLKSMLILLASVLIAGSFTDDADSKQIVLAGHRVSTGVVAGAFSDQLHIDNSLVTNARMLYGRAEQAAPEFGQSGGAGLLLADKLGQGMTAPLRVSRHNKSLGIGSLLTPARQLKFIA